MVRLKKKEVLYINKNIVWYKSKVFSSFFFLVYGSTIERV